MQNAENPIDSISSLKMTIYICRLPSNPIHRTNCSQKMMHASCLLPLGIAQTSLVLLSLKRSLDDERRACSRSAMMMQASHGSHSTAAFNVVFHAQVAAVEHSISVLRNPIAQDEQARLMGKHEVEFNVAMTKEEEIDVGVGFQIFLGVEHQRFLIFPHVRRVATLSVRQAATLGPCKSETNPEVGMEPTEKLLAEAIVKNFANELELAVGVAQAISVTDVECLVGQRKRHWFAMQRDATLSDKVFPSPDIVVARKEMNLYAHIREFRQFAEETCVALWHHLVVFKPEVEHVAQEIDGFGLVLNVVEEAHQAALLLASVRQCFAAQMGIREEID